MKTAPQKTTAQLLLLEWSHFTIGFHPQAQKIKPDVTVHDSRFELEVRIRENTIKGHCVTFEIK